MSPFYRPAAAADGLTVVARVLETDQIVGVLLTDHFGAPPAIDLSEISDKFMPILTMFEGLDENYRKGRAIVAGQYLHLFMLAVDRHFVGQGIAQQLVTARLLNGRQKGYTHASPKRPEWSRNVFFESWTSPTASA